MIANTAMAQSCREQIFAAAGPTQLSEAGDAYVALENFKIGRANLHVQAGFQETKIVGADGNRSFSSIYVGEEGVLTFDEERRKPEYFIDSMLSLIHI